MHKNFILFLVFLGLHLNAQTKGVVIDNLGDPIPYVSIFVENENKTTTSEENGTFSIQVLAEAKLIFSALGYEKKTVLAKDAARVVLKSVIFDLEEVVSLVKNGNYIDINTEEGKTWMHLKTMKLAEARFCHTGQFIRVNQSVIVAIKKVDFVQDKRIVHLKDGSKFDLSKGYRAAFLEELVT